MHRKDSNVLQERDKFVNEVFPGNWSFADLPNWSYNARTARSTVKESSYLFLSGIQEAIILDFRRTVESGLGMPASERPTRAKSLRQSSRLH